MNRYPGAVPLLHDLLLAAAEARPDHTALVAGGARLSYAEVDRRSNALAHALAGRGVVPRDRVLVLGENSPDTALAFWAALKASAVPVMISPQTRSDKLRYLIADCRPAALIADRALAPVVAAALVGAPPVRALLTAGGAAAALADAVALEHAIAGERGDQPPDRRVIDADLATIIYTSGSTGDPKGVMHTHRSMRAAAASIGAYLEIGPDEVILDVLPLSFDYGLYQMILAFAAGARLVLERSFAFPGHILGRIGEERVTGFPGVPTMFAIIAAMKDLSGFDLSPVRFVTNTAAALGGKHVAAIRRAFPRARIYSMYGLTECKRVSYLPPEDLERKPTSVGLPIPNTEVWIAGDDGRRVGPGQVGEVVVRGATVMRGYWEKPRETAIKLRPGPLPGELVLHTGDLGMQDDEGYLYFIARRDDVIKSRGEKVAPREVEEALLAIAGVHEAAVIGVADELLGQAPAAFVVLEPGVSLTVPEILRACRDRLESHMVPKYVELVADLPKTVTGKIRKTGLAAARAATRSGGEEA